MKFTLAILAVAAVSALPQRALNTEQRSVLDEDLIASINSKNLGWTAGVNPRFEGMSLSEAKGLLGLRIPEASVSCSHLMKRQALDDVDVPAAFDSRTQWKGLIGEIRDQASCGSCWAFAAAETLSDRTAIASNGTINEALSPQVLVSCDTMDMGCSGGWPEYAADYLVAHGIPSDACVPYTSSGGSVESCPSTCTDGSAIKTHKYKSWAYAIGVNAIEAAVSSTGPVAVSMAVYQDFFSYRKGVYKWDGASGLAGYHAIKLVGYTADYWIVANSWGTGWGEKGFFNIVKGTNECGIELGALDKACPIYGTPDV